MTPLLWNSLISIVSHCAGWTGSLNLPVYPRRPAHQPPIPSPTPIHHHSIPFAQRNTMLPSPPQSIHSLLHFPIRYHIHTHSPSPGPSSPPCMTSSLYFARPRTIHTPTTRNLTTALHARSRKRFTGEVGGIGAVVTVYSMVVDEGERVIRRGVEVVNGYILAGC